VEGPAGQLARRATSPGPAQRGPEFGHRVGAFEQYAATRAARSPIRSITRITAINCFLDHSECFRYSDCPSRGSQRD